MTKGKRGGDYTVGYGRPPAGSRFQPGQSGNPKGRPKKRQLSFDELLNAQLRKPVTVHQEGAKERITCDEALIRMFFSLAMKGNMRAMVTLLKLIEQRPPDAGDTKYEDAEVVRAVLRDRINRMASNIALANELVS